MFGEFSDVRLELLVTQMYCSHVISINNKNQGIKCSVVAKHTKGSLNQGPIVQITLFNLRTEPVEEAQGRLLCHSGGLRSE